jgi:hypothetical protein
MSYFIGLPTGDEKSNIHQVMQIMKYNKDGNFISSAATCAGVFNFNILWSGALNLRSKGVTHFVMLHSDIMIQDSNWLEILREEMDKNDADIISAIVPVKDMSGVTSTALVTDEANWDFKRLTMTEVFSMPETFTDKDLVVNNGLLLVDLRKPWVDKVWFNFSVRMDLVNGMYAPKMLPEDWAFSLDARKLGAKIYATRRTKVTHFGNYGYSNNFAWGSCKTDPQVKEKNGN